MDFDSDRVEGQARAAMRDAADDVRSSVAQARSELHDLDRHARQFVRERPLAALLAALAAGFLVGRMASRV